MKIQIHTEPQKPFIMDRVKTFEDACRELGITGEAHIELSDNLSGFSNLIEYTLKVAIVTKALNEGWTPDWDNYNERKWCICFDMRTNSFSLNRVYEYFHSSFIPSYLCFKSKELAEYAVYQFPYLYKSFFLGK